MVPPARRPPDPLPVSAMMRKPLPDNAGAAMERRHVTARLAEAA